MRRDASWGSALQILVKPGEHRPPLQCLAHNIVKMSVTPSSPSHPEPARSRALVLFRRTRPVLLLLALAVLYFVEPDLPDREVAAAAALDTYQRIVFAAHVALILAWHPATSLLPMLSLGGGLPARPSHAASDSTRRNLFSVWLVRGAARRLLVLGAIGIVLAVTLNFWVLLLWCAFLAGLVAGRVLVPTSRPLRAAHGLAFGFLLLFLVLEVVPGLLPLAIAIPAATLRLYQGAAYILPALLTLMFICLVLEWWAETRQSAHTPESDLLKESHDLIYTVAVFGMVVLATFTTLALMLIGGISYLSAWTIALLALAGLLLLVTWGFSGSEGGLLGMVFARYVMSVGLPYELWLESLTRLYQAARSPSAFLDEALRQLQGVPVLLGARWEAPSSSSGPGSFGLGAAPVASDLVTEIVAAPIDLGSQPTLLKVELVSRRALSPALVWHIKLLVHLAAELYAAKWREERLAQANYVRAVHETGARLTHDIKNILQSLQGMVAVAQSGVEAEAAQQLMTRQLPILTQRLQSALGKLQAPSTDSQRLIRISVWYAEAAQRYAHTRVTWGSPQIEFDAPVASGMFDSIADNLIGNALAKVRADGSAVNVVVTLEARGGRVHLDVCDDGLPMTEDVRTNLFEAPIRSATGLGLGLYQAAQLARANQFALMVVENLAGRVRLRLTN